MRKILHSIKKSLLSLLEGHYSFFGTKNVILEASEIDSEFLDNFDNIGDYKRVFPFQTQSNVIYSQTKPNLNNGVIGRKDIYAPPINSFSVSSHQSGLQQVEVLSRKYTMKNSYSKDYNTPKFSGKSDIQSNNYVYVKKNNGYIKNWHTNKTEWSEISVNECVKIENCSSTKTYFNMHNLKNEKSKNTGSVIMLDLYMS